jgi:hypothetical protein
MPREKAGDGISVAHSPRPLPPVAPVPSPAPGSIRHGWQHRPGVTHQPTLSTASNRASLFAIVQTVVVEHKIGGIDHREEYLELHHASPEAEAVFFSKLQGTLQTNLRALGKSERDFKLVAIFFEDDATDPMIDFVRDLVFGREAGRRLTSHEQASPHSIRMLCTPLPLLERYVHLLCNESSPPQPP